MDSKLQRFCDGLLEAGWLAALVITPLYFNIHSSRVFEPDKLTLLRSIAVFMVAVWLTKFIDQQGWRSLGWLGWRSENSIWRMPFVLPVFLLAIVYIVSTIFSITPVVSWAGSYQRLQGTYSTLSYIVIFALMLATIRERGQVTRVITTIIVTSIPVALYAMLQHYDLDPLPWGGDTQRRVAGSMGNSIFIAAYIIMVVPLTLARIIDAFTNILTDEKLEAADIIRSSIYVFAFAIQLIAIFWTNSRGPFIGLAASGYAFLLILLVTLRNAQSEERRLSGADLGRSILIVALGTLAPLLLSALVLESRISALASFAVFIGAVGVLVLVILIMALAGRGWRWLWLSWIILAVTMAGFLGLFNVDTAAAEDFQETPVVGETISALSTWRRLPAIGRFGNLLQSERGSGRVRVLIWEGTLDLVDLHEPLERPDGQEDPFNFLRPIIGYGPESMYVAYNRFYPPELATIEARNASPDRAHNETFDAVVITGAAGLLVWQFLYLSVFYYGFRWLGVVKSTRDRNVLIGLWIGGAIVGGGLITAVLGAPFVGVAVPFGAIIGLVIYLIYYAVFSRSGDDGESNPFAVDRLIMIGLVAAVLAHYVEIHFGIAIASTRTHFFAYVALMFLIGHFLPRRQQTIEEMKALPKRRRRSRKLRTVSADGWVGPVLGSALVLSLIIGILAYDFMTFSLPPGEEINSVADVPTVGAIFHQSFFVNAKQGFVDSPFIFLLLVISWILGGLLFLSELSKRGVLGSFTTSGRTKEERLRIGAYILVALAALGVLSIVLQAIVAVALRDPLFIILAIWRLLFAVAYLWVAYRIVRDPVGGQAAAGVVALVSLVVALPLLLVPGATVSALINIAIMGAVLFMVWDSNWAKLLWPIMTMALISLALGLMYAFLHGSSIVDGILPPPGVTESTPGTVRRVLEANQTINILTVFYVFLFTVLFASGFALAWEKYGQVKRSGSIAGAVALLVLSIAAFVIVGQTNLQVIQADIVYKRADPWDKQAGRARDPALWDNAIAIYERAIELAPREDFYYLWLGRAYLERSSVTEDPVEQGALLKTAEERLIEAQRINPLNTDHTANLARLNTRWAETASGEEREQRVEIASDYYEAAMSLSPNNAVIINEYARLAFVLDEDCQKAVDLFDRSRERDPYFTATLFERFEVLRVCGDRQEDEAERLRYYELAAESLAEGLERETRSAQEWLQLAGLYIALDRADEAEEAYATATELAGDDLEQWRIDYTMADLFLQEGQLDRAEEFAYLALEGAPDDVAAQIQQFIDQIVTARDEVEG